MCLRPFLPSCAGGASGVFNTAQQLGGALGVAVVGSVFFARVGSVGVTAGFELAMPLAIGAFAACAALSLVLPWTAVGEAYEQAAAPTARHQRTVRADGAPPAHPPPQRQLSYRG